MTFKQWLEGMAGSDPTKDSTPGQTTRMANKAADKILGSTTFADDQAKLLRPGGNSVKQKVLINATADGLKKAVPLAISSAAPPNAVSYAIQNKLKSATNFPKPKV